MKSLWIDFKDSLKILKDNYYRFTKYQIITKLLLIFILMPIFKMIFDLLMRSRGFDYLTNGLIQKFLISPQGIVVIIFAIILSYIAILLEIGGLVVITNQALSNEPENSLISIFRHSLKRIKYLFGVDGILLALYLIILAPMLDNSLKTSLISNLKIPGFVMDVIKANGFYMSMLVIVFVIGFLLSFRWMFSIHILMLRDRKEKHFLRESGRLVFSNIKNILKYMLGIFIMEIFFLIIVLFIYLAFCLFIFAIFSNVGLSMQGIENLIIILFGVGLCIFFIGAFFLMPMQLIIMTKLYYRISGEEIKYLNIAKSKKDNFLDKLLKNKLIISLICIIGIVFASIYLNELFNSMDEIKYNVQITAHRGSSVDAPENSISAIKTAIENGADYAEIDVQQTKDGEVILLHDSNFKRTAGIEKMPVDMNIDEIRKLDIGSWFSDEFKGEKVVTLQEVIDFSEDKIKLNIEIKGNDRSDMLIEKVVEIINKNNFKNKCVVTSLNYDDLLKVEKLDPNIKTGYIMFVAMGNIDKLDVDFYSVEESNVSEEFILKAHRIGREVHVWTINTEESMENVLELGVDNIITDYDKKLRSIINSKRKQKK